MDGSVRKCNGYEFTVTEDELLQVMDGVKEVYDAYYGGAADALKLKLGMTFRSSEIEHAVWGISM